MKKAVKMRRIIADVLASTNSLSVEEFNRFAIRSISFFINALSSGELRFFPCIPILGICQTLVTIHYIQQTSRHKEFPVQRSYCQMNYNKTTFQGIMPIKQ